MSHLILTGATSGIGRALAIGLATTRAQRLILLGRNRAKLAALTADIASRSAKEPLVFVCDLRDLAATRTTAEQIAQSIDGDVTLIHNAGIWPHRRELTIDGFEAAYAVNFLAPLVLQAPLLDGRLRRILTTGAGLMIKGRIDAKRTPSGADFGSIRTYCTTKLCLAIAMRQIAAEHPALDIAVAHPGVAATALGDRPGVIGWLLKAAKRGWEMPETCAARLQQLVARPRWSNKPDAAWFVEEREAPWPAAANNAAAYAFVWEARHRPRNRATG